jgi:hypothetical protein
MQNKERILKAEEKWQVTNKGKSIRIAADFSTYTLNTKNREWYISSPERLKENNSQPRLVYPAKVFFIIEGEIKNIHNKQKLKEYIATKLALQKLLKGILHTDEENRHS